MDPTLRVTVFTWVVSLLVVTYRRGWAKILCARCRTKYALFFDLQNFFMGWWGIPFGVCWTLEALWHNSLGGQQPEENNALFLAGLGNQSSSRKGDLKAAVSARRGKLRLKKRSTSRNVLPADSRRGSTRPRLHAHSEPRLSLWQRLRHGCLASRVYCAPLLAILFGVASMWVEPDNQSAVRARSGVALQQGVPRQEVVRRGG